MEVTLFPAVSVETCNEVSRISNLFLRRIIWHENQPKIQSQVWHNIYLHGIRNTNIDEPQLDFAWSNISSKVHPLPLRPTSWVGTTWVIYSTSPIAFALQFCRTDVKYVTCPFFYFYSRFSKPCRLEWVSCNNGKFNILPLYGLHDPNISRMTLDVGFVWILLDSGLRT